MVSHQPGSNTSLVPLVTFFNVVLVALVLLVNTRPGSAQVKPEDLLDCVIREMREYVNRTMVVNGRVLRCEGPVRIKTCFGRCISYEYGNYRIPFKISHHPVCTYDSWKARTVTPPWCHRDHPDPTATVYDAERCKCKECDSETTSCENLKG